MYSAVLKRKRKLLLDEKSYESKENILLIRINDVKKNDEQKFEAKIIDKCGEMTQCLSKRMDELSAKKSVAVTSLKTEKMLQRAIKWSEESMLSLESILHLESSPEQHNRTLDTCAATTNNASCLLETTFQRKQHQDGQGLSTSFTTAPNNSYYRATLFAKTPSRKSLSINPTLTPTRKLAQKNDSPYSGVNRQNLETPDVVRETLNKSQEMSDNVECPPTPVLPPKPLPDIHVVEDELNFGEVKKSDKKQFTIQNRLPEFKMIRITGIRPPFYCNARVINAAPKTQIPIMIEFKPKHAGLCESEVTFTCADVFVETKKLIGYGIQTKQIG